MGISRTSDEGVCCARAERDWHVGLPLPLRERAGRRFGCSRAWIVAALLSLTGLWACAGESTSTPSGSAAACADPDPSGFCQGSAQACEVTPRDGPVPRCDAGSGRFGVWGIDLEGLPAFQYRHPPREQAAAAWPLSDGSERHDHLAQFGNDRFIAYVSTQGRVELLTRDHGPVVWNRYDPGRGRHAGGYSVIVEGDALWAAAREALPEGADWWMTWGVGYVRHVAGHRGLLVDRELRAPFGSHPYLLSTVTLENQSERARSFWHMEYWDVNHHPLEVQLARSGRLGATVPRRFDDDRARLNRFYEAGTRQHGADALCVHHQWAGPPEVVVPLDQPSGRLYHPQAFCLVGLEYPPGRGGVLSKRAHWEQLQGGADVRALLAEGAVHGTHVEALDQPFVLVDAREVTLAPGQRVTLRYALGWGPQGPPEVVPPAVDISHGESVVWRGVLPWVDVGDGAVQREMAWHAHQLFAGGARDAYYDTHLLVQGGAYQVLHGLDGAARDYALFTLPTVYLRPDYAKELLRMIMRMRNATTEQISYATQGYGMNEGAGIHTTPSDLDLFFLWALAEYLSATGDVAFLDELQSWWPRDARPASTTREHARSSLTHLMDVVGRGHQGLIRLRTGDWSDGITFEAPDRNVAAAQGESVPNSQMALWVLPRVFPWLGDDADPLIARARTYVDDLRSAVEAQWVGRWFRRAWWRPGAPYGDDFIDLEAQVWALIGELISGTRTSVWLDALRALDEAPFGATLREGGQMWHAVAGLHTWGLLRYDPVRALSHYRRHTMRAHAETHPDVWFGVWSGPDGLLLEGGSWVSEVTPMADFPIGNLNQHAMPLLATIRLAGIEPSAGERRLQIAPVVPVRLHTALLDVEADAATTRVVYRGAPDAAPRVTALGEGRAVLVLE